MTTGRDRFIAIADEYRAIQKQADQLTAALTEEQARFRPSPTRWSIAECLLHLNTATKGYLERLERACREAPLTETPPLQSTLFGRLFVWWMEPPARLKAPAPKPFLPPQTSEPLAEILQTFRGMNDRLELAAREAAQRDFTGVTISSPVSKKLRFAVSDTFAFIAAHERRHLWQAAKIRQALSSSSSASGPRF